MRQNPGLSVWSWLWIAVPIVNGCELLPQLAWDARAPSGDSDEDMDAGRAPDAAPDAEDAEADTDAADVAEHDATMPAEDDATTPAEDAALDAGPDANDCDAGACDAPCVDDGQCAPDQYCARRQAVCRPRCDSAGACMGPAIATSNNWLVTDGAHVCYVAPEQADGGARQLVQSWDGVAAEPRTIAAGTDVRVLLVADGYCYFSDPVLKRARLSGGDEQVVVDARGSAGEQDQEHAAAVRRAWLAPEYVWWTAPSADGFDVYRIARTPDASAELFTSAPPTHLWEAGNSTRLFRREPGPGSCSVVMAPIDDLSAEVSVPMSFSRRCGGMLSADEQSVFFDQYEPVHSYLFRIDFSDPTRQIQTGLSSHAGVALLYQQYGDFIYGSRALDGGRNDPSFPVYYPYRIEFYRVARTAEAPAQVAEQVFVPVPSSAQTEPAPDGDQLPGGGVDGYGNHFAVLGERLVFLSAQEPRLLVADLPRAP
jgi:hypothetical protein